jgi:hypothetical protein
MIFLDYFKKIIDFSTAVIVLRIAVNEFPGKNNKSLP